MGPAHPWPLATPGSLPPPTMAQGPGGGVCVYRGPVASWNRQRTALYSGSAQAWAPSCVVPAPLTIHLQPAQGPHSPTVCHLQV